MISVVAQSARARRRRARRRSTPSSSRAARPPRPGSCSSGAARPIRSTCSAIDTYWICTAEHGLNASTFTARVVASTGADCAASLSSAVGALSGPLHGGAPARVLPMLDGAAAADSIEELRQAICSTRGERLMGFGHRVYRAEDPRSRLLRGTAMDLGSPRFEVAEELERAALAELHARKPDRVARDERRVLVGGRARRRRRCRRASRRRCSPARAPPAGRRTSSSRSGSAGSSARRRLRRPRPALARRAADGSRAGRRARRRVREGAGLERELATLRSEWADEIEASAPRRRLPGARARVPRRSPSSASARSSSCSAAGSRTTARPCGARP